MAYQNELELIKILEQFSMQNIPNDLLSDMVHDRIKIIDDWKKVRRGMHPVLIKILEACDQNIILRESMEICSCTY